MHLNFLGGSILVAKSLAMIKMFYPHFFNEEIAFVSIFLDSFYHRKCTPKFWVIVSLYGYTKAQAKNENQKPKRKREKRGIEIV